MSNVTKPMLLDETGQRIATALETIAQNGGGSGGGGASQNASPYITTTCDWDSLTKDRVVNVDGIIALFEKYNIPTIINVFGDGAPSIGQTGNTSVMGGASAILASYTTQWLYYSYDSCAGGNRLNLFGRSYILSSDVTDLKDALNSKKTEIESAPLYSYSPSSNSSDIIYNFFISEGLTEKGTWITYDDLLTLCKDAPSQS